MIWWQYDDDMMMIWWWCPIVSPPPASCVSIFSLQKLKQSEYWFWKTCRFCKIRFHSILNSVIHTLSLDLQQTKWSLDVTNCKTLKSPFPSVWKTCLNAMTSQPWIGRFFKDFFYKQWKFVFPLLQLNHCLVLSQASAFHRVRLWVGLKLFGFFPTNIQGMGWET